MLAPVPRQGRRSRESHIMTPPHSWEANKDTLETQLLNWMLEIFIIVPVNKADHKINYEQRSWQKVPD